MRDFLEDQGGGVAVMTAAVGLALCALAAISVDVASVALHARRVQGEADLAATAAAMNFSQASEIAQATVEANNPGDTVEVEVGVYTPDRDLAPDQRFQPGGEANAVRATVTSPVKLHFGAWIMGRSHYDVTRHATAAVAGHEPVAAFSIGSRLARLDGGLVNGVLSDLLGAQVSLSVMDYRALADAHVDLPTLLDAIADDLDLTAATYDELLDTRVSSGAVLNSIASLLDGTAATVASRLGLAATSGGGTLKLSDLLGGEGLTVGGFKAQVSALDLASAVIEVASGDRQVDVGLDAPTGLADVQVKVAIGERPNNSPWMTITDEDTVIVRTAQARVLLNVKTAQALSGLTQVKLPVVVELAASEAKLGALGCTPHQVTLDVRPGLARAWIGEIDTATFNDFKRAMKPKAVTLLSVAGLVRVKGYADVEIADTNWTSVKFDAADIRNRSTRTVKTTQIAQGAISSLLGRLQVDVEALGLGLGLGGLTSSLMGLLSPLGPTLDAVLNPVLDLVGLKLGEADVKVNGLNCPDTQGRAPRLVG